MQSKTPGALVLSLLASACVNIHERYHIRADGADEDGRPVTNYYRVTIDGWTCLSASQYASGYYDAEAVDALFGELEGKTVAVDGVSLAGHEPRTTPGAKTDKQEEAGKSSDSDSGTARPEGKPAAAKPAQTTLTSLDGKPLGNKKLVLFLSTNADALVNQISSLISKNSIQQALTTMLLGDELQDVETAKLQAEKESQEDRLLAETLATIAKKVSVMPAATDPEKKAIADEICRALQALARSSGSDGAETIIDQATAMKWLEDHPEAFQLDGGTR